ncbi:MAG: hypothetical protein HZC28_01660 [Spirochaetes bacterium]|nr:hypothetical protein [Spirochaetota bacterium]
MPELPDIYIERLEARIKGMTLENIRLLSFFLLHSVDPHLYSGIDNAYSDEILHRAKLSPILLTAKISDNDAKRLFNAVRTALAEWTERLRRETGGKLLADRALSRLLKGDWPSSVDELEAMRKKK